MTDQSETIENKVVEQPEQEDDENPLKKKKGFVMTPARAETLKKGREKRMANIKKIQEEKQLKHEEEKQKKREVKVEVQQKVKEKVEKKLAKDKKKVSIVVPESESEESSDDDDYEIEIKKKPRARSAPPPQRRETYAETPNVPNIILI